MRPFYLSSFYIIVAANGLPPFMAACYTVRSRCTCSTARRYPDSRSWKYRWGRGRNRSRRRIRFTYWIKGRPLWSRGKMLMSSGISLRCSARQMWGMKAAASRWKQTEALMWV